MAFMLYSLLQAALLWVNSITIPHKEHFLKNIGWGTDQGMGRFRKEPGFRSVSKVMGVSLIIVNSITIVLLLLLG
ncbi:immediate early response 3-interacting protein 1-like [Onychomys torridus]|uniref:immediate early response 3-interacting protein 1-like n=1 Tax=Onychomys torridus TaxID=38674 RepID=UPI00167F8A76|nr:immediate early response 3-interacting protein 1-like [Onychomys torridus]